MAKCGAQRGEAVPGVRSPSVATVVSARRRDPDPIFAAVASDTATSPVADGGPAVRIHIGRLDVRANLESAPSSRPSAQQRRTMPEPVSLDDYLAGRRGRR